MKSKNVVKLTSPTSPTRRAAGQSRQSWACSCALPRLHSRSGLGPREQNGQGPPPIRDVLRNPRLAVAPSRHRACVHADAPARRVDLRRTPQGYHRRLAAGEGPLPRVEPAVLHVHVPRAAVPVGQLATRGSCPLPFSDQALRRRLRHVAPRGIEPAAPLLLDRPDGRITRAHSTRACLPLSNADRWLGLLRRSPHNRLVHFVREPAEMVASGYLYHLRQWSASWTSEWHWTASPACSRDLCQVPSCWTRGLAHRRARSILQGLRARPFLLNYGCRCHAHGNETLQARHHPHLASCAFCHSAYTRRTSRLPILSPPISQACLQELPVHEGLMVTAGPLLLVYSARVL